MGEVSAHHSCCGCGKLLCGVKKTGREMKNNTLKQFHRGFSFLITIAVVLLVLKLLNWLPSVLEHEGLRKYRSVDDVRAVLKIPRVYIPAYFPEHIQWPPAEIFAQRKPFPMIMMHFTHRDSKSFALSLFQVDSRASFELPYKTDILYVRKESPVQIRGRSGTLVIAVCSGRERCNRISWEEGRYRLTLIADDTPEQMIKMAESVY